MTRGDAGESLVDAESRLADCLDELEQVWQRRSAVVLCGDPEQIRQLELCRLARTDLQRQLEATAHDVRRT